MSKKSLKFIAVLLFSALFLFDAAFLLQAEQELSAALRIRGYFSDFGRYNRGREEKTGIDKCTLEAALHSYFGDEIFYGFDFASLWSSNRSIDPSSYYYFVHSSKSPPEYA